MDAASCRSPSRRREVSLSDQVTQVVINRIAFVFDFDETLAEDSFSALLRRCGLEGDFEEVHVEPLVEAGWEKMLARTYALVQASRRGPTKITRDLLTEVGKDIRLYEGVQGLFSRLREVVARITPEVETEFYILTSGFAEIPKATPIAGEFKAIFGGEFYFDDSGELSFVKKTIPHAEKTNYMLMISKGTGEANNNPAHAYREVSRAELHVPLSQMVYLGDGASDIPVFNLMYDRRGVALGLFADGDANTWDSGADIHAGQRVENLVRSDYRENSELTRSLVLATEAICKKIALRQLSSGK